MRLHLHHLTAVACIIAWLFIFATLAGCSSPQPQPQRLAQINATLKAVETERSAAQTRIDAAREELAKSDIPQERREQITAALNRLTAALTKLEQIEKSLQEQKAQLASDDPGEVIAATGRAVGSAVPGYGGLITLGATLVGGIVSAAYRARAKAAEDAIGAVTLTADAGLTQIDTSALDQMQSPAAKKAVTRAQARARAKAKTLAPLLRKRHTHGQSNTAQPAAPSA